MGSNSSTSSAGRGEADDGEDLRHVGMDESDDSVEDDSDVSLHPEPRSAEDLISVFQVLIRK